VTFPPPDHGESHHHPGDTAAGCAGSPVETENTSTIDKLAFFVAFLLHHFRMT